LSAIVNTGDDFQHLGFCISPDLDTVLYTLAGIAHRELGWGLQNETWSFMTALERLGGETWFRLGDADLAVHVERTRRLAAGARLSEVTAIFAERLKVAARIVPMSDARVRTLVRTPAGEMSFQHYFVREKCAPEVTDIQFSGAASAEPVEAALSALRDTGLRAVVIAPSNPYLSIDPILAVPGLRQAVAAARAPVIAVSPLIGGAAVKGPTAKIMQELHLQPSAATIARHYGALIDGFVLDSRDRDLGESFNVPVEVCDTLMRTIEDRERLAGQVLGFADRLAPGKSGSFG
jgi:LPPG:FO 2-phospho-L-lactate transferase